VHREINGGNRKRGGEKLKHGRLDRRVFRRGVSERGVRSYVFFKIHVSIACFTKNEYAN
jgi:hypothetical protein